MSPEEYDQRLQRVRKAADEIGDTSVSDNLRFVLDNIDTASNTPVVVSSLRNLRKYKGVKKEQVLQLACELGELALAKSPDSTFVLAELATALKFRGLNDQVIEKITDFDKRRPLVGLDPKDRDYLTVILATAYRGKGDSETGIRILEALNSHAPGVREALAELYYTVRRPDKAITLLQDERSLTVSMALSLGKSLKALGRIDDAVMVISPFKDNPKMRRFFEQVGLEREKASAQLSGKSKARQKVFVVHGHDEVATQTVARFLEKLKLEPIVLSEQPNEGRTIIEKFEAHADVSFAIVLLTPDDLGCPKDRPDQLRPRARQNVILELGYFIGRLTRQRVCALHKGSTEIPSDFHGVVYVPMDEGGGWKLKLVTELKQAGLDLDLNLV